MQHLSCDWGLGYGKYKMPAKHTKKLTSMKYSIEYWFFWSYSLILNLELHGLHC